jgi:ATP-dependent RNA helicase RhlE
VEQRFYSVTTDDKRAAVIKLLKDRGSSRPSCSSTPSSVARAWPARSSATACDERLHGDKSQDERLKALEAFKRGEVDVLVATDVAARGLDIADLPAVFNFDVPFNAEDYVHRIGRTGPRRCFGPGRHAGHRDDARLVADIEKLIKKKIELEPIELDDARPPREERPRPRRG